MNKFRALASSAVLASASLVAGTAGANAAPNPRYDNAIQGVCANRMSDPSCHDWYVNHNRWSDAQYRNFYSAHRGWNWGTPGIAGLFGFAIGSAIAGAAANAMTSNSGGLTPHQQACAARYRTYNPATDSYVYDSAGHTTLCRL